LVCNDLSAEKLGHGKFEAKHFSVCILDKIKTVSTLFSGCFCLLFARFVRGKCRSSLVDRRMSGMIVRIVKFEKFVAA
jgi:hypothetical protein